LQKRESGFRLAADMGRVTCFKEQAIHAQKNKGGEIPSFFFITACILKSLFSENWGGRRRPL